MNILRQEMRLYRNSLLAWSLSLPLVALFFLSIYPSFARDLDQLIKLLQSFPQTLREAMGLENFGFGGTLGYYSFVVLYILLAGSIQAMNLGVSALSAEVRDKTADFLYAKPVSRGQIIWWKMLAILLQLLITNLVFLAAAWLMVAGINDSLDLPAVDFRLFLLLSGTLGLIQLFFASLGLLVSAFMKRIRTVLPISMGVVFFFYIINVLNETLKNEHLGYLTPFNYFNPEKVLVEGAYSARYLIILAVTVAVCLTGTAVLYGKKDLPSI